MKTTNTHYMSFIAVLFVCIVVELFQPDYANCRDKGIPIESGPKITVGELLKDKNIKLKTWYWVDIRPINIDKNLYNPAYPLLEGSKAIVVPASFYDKAGLRTAWVGFMFEKIQTSGGEEIVLKRRVELMHYGRELNPDNPEDFKEVNADTFKSMSLRGRDAPNVYYFKRVNSSKASEITADDAAFLRSYYMVGLINSVKGSLNCMILKVNVKVGAYINYDYYPSGAVSRKTEIELESDKNEPIFYGVYTQAFNDKGMKQKPKAVDKTILRDPSSSMWVQNILHD